MAALRLLPNEILSIITSHLEGPKDVLHLALTNRRLAEFARLDGWKALLRGRFGLTGLDSDARSAVQGITTLYKNWGRKALLARYLEPTPTVTSLNTWQTQSWRGPRGQTMGYQPHIDSFEEIYGAWNERVEVLAWSAGTHILIRIKKSGKSAKILWEDDQEYGHDEYAPWAFDAFRHLTSWYTYQIPESFEGRDDITDLKLLRPHQSPEDTFSLVFGTASGQLTLLSWSTEEAETFVQHYSTDGRAISSLSVSASSKPYLAATLGDSSLALYPIDHDLEYEDPIAPLSEVSPIIPGALNGRLWSCNFLSNERVAIGLGPSYEPVQVFEITTAGFLAAPLRTFNLEYKFWRGTIADNSISRSTVYPTLAIPSMAHGGSEAGNTFLSGGYDGIIRLHDMRSHRGFETMFWDQTNDSSIYSLAAQGLERIVAGVSMHSMIKVFDIRVPGSHAYSSSLKAPTRTKVKADRPDVTYNAVVERSREGPAAVSGGWNLYLNPRTPPKRNAYREDYWRNRADGPVYSLSIPSPFSPNLYTGLEGIVQSLTFHSIADPHPDPVLSQSIVHFADSGAIDIRSSYNSQGDALNLGMYEQGNEDGLGMQLLVQDGVSTGVVKNKQRQDLARSRGLDERWRDLRDENNRWSRGVTQQEPRRGGMLNRRGRGRGRGGHGRGRGG